MKIIVCIKQVPDTTEVRLNPETGTLIREGVPSIINPDDKCGLEAALVLKDKYDAHVTVLTMGPTQADFALKEALAMGADEAILMTDRAFAGADTWATSLTLAKALEKMEYDLIIAGRQAIDGDTAQVGPELAEHLKIPHVSYVEALEKGDDSSLILKRKFEDGYHKVKVKMPCLITTLSEMNKPRYMKVGLVFDAHREKEIKKLTFDDLDINKEEIGLKGSPTKVKKSFTKGAKTAGKLYKDLDEKEAAKLIVEKLKEKFII
ncbi:MAG: electron transfer flavoprotein subunit beta/FixA family protein [Tissierellales bacterium]|jgi:electron transfer flavoprotein beta subunit|nr:electron transfer flavoprotein subunit beta/FixA family protein [Tissierellales bacterium]